MPVYQKELNRLKQAGLFVRRNFPHFGVNKKQEAVRLLYEISKREEAGPDRIIQAGNQDYELVKKELLARRYPASPVNCRPYLPKIELNRRDFACLKPKPFYPRKIFIEQKARQSNLERRFRELFPQAKFSEIDSLKSWLCRQRDFKINDYNQRRDTVFITHQEQDFFKACPCTNKAIGCGYHIFNLGFGCVFDCTYCFLQGYTNSPGIILPENLEDFFRAFPKYKRKGMRLGTGEFSDSLALDNFTGYSSQLIDFFRQHKDVLFEFKTKSNQVGNLLKARHAGNIVVSWSLNPQKIIRENEYFTATLAQRLTAARKCADSGYRLGFHFDPVIYFAGWEKEYAALIEALFSKIKPSEIAWISVGTFRFSPSLKPVIEKRFPANKVLDEELLLGYDNKLRYDFKLRENIYRRILNNLRKHSQKLNIYLCMEEAPIKL